MALFLHFPPTLRPLHHYSQGYRIWERCIDAWSTKNGVASQVKTKRAKLVLQTGRVWFMEAKNPKKLWLAPDTPRKVLRRLQGLEELEMAVSAADPTMSFSLADLSYAPDLRSITLSGPLTTKSVYSMPHVTSGSLKAKPSSAYLNEHPNILNPSPASNAYHNMIFTFLVIPCILVVGIPYSMAESTVYKTSKTARRTETPLVDLGKLRTLRLLDCKISGTELIQFGRLLETVTSLELGMLQIDERRPADIDTFMKMMAGHVTHLTLGYLAPGTESTPLSKTYNELLLLSVPHFSKLTTFAFHLSSPDHKYLRLLIKSLPFSTTAINFLALTKSDTVRLSPLSPGGCSIPKLIAATLDSDSPYFQVRDDLKEVTIKYINEPLKGWELDPASGALPACIWTKEMRKDCVRAQQCWHGGVRVILDVTFADGRRRVWGREEVIGEGRFAI